VLYASCNRNKQSRFGNHEFVCGQDIGRYNAIGACTKVTRKVYIIIKNEWVGFWVDEIYTHTSQTESPSGLLTWVFLPLPQYAIATSSTPITPYSKQKVNYRWVMVVARGISAVFEYEISGRRRVRAMALEGVQSIGTADYWLPQLATDGILYGTAITYGHVCDVWR